MNPSQPYEEGLYERLSDLEYAAEYISACDSLESFLLALRDVADAKSGMGELAKDSGLNRESLYRTLSASGNPKLSGLISILGTLGLRLSVRPLRCEEIDPLRDPVSSNFQQARSGGAPLLPFLQKKSPETAYSLNAAAAHSPQVITLRQNLRVINQ